LGWLFGCYLVGPGVSDWDLLRWVTHDYLKLGIAYATLFVMTLLAVGLLNMALGAMIKSTGLSPADRGLGALFGWLEVFYCCWCW